MHSILAYLKHILIATNQHGVHSPFVYDYLTKCLYVKHQRSKQKYINIFLKSIRYFNTKTLLIVSDSNGLKQIAIQEFPELQFGVPPYDMVFTEASDPKEISEILLKNKEIHNDTVLVVNNIHKSKATELVWKQLQYDRKVTVTIDLFYCGMVFFRKEQAKEHFKIRI
ncbi:hypothetical protein FGM00_11615 [Aggregatimonas sangjinii]|uniref:Uncharacterized protein n=1 Tax=Aggregatimonas sangjinii TaxID=2583587 RepID=A0A5B7SR61_9FLAO|nr:hypothetical protein [Aggregatimonas sangjinii]QCX00722.1 hypothetical protein FGM00_11615 [Aggregatimonas sangjinii]